LLWIPEDDISMLVHKHAIPGSYIERIYSPGGSSGQERNDEFKRVDETQTHDVSSLDTIMLSKNISELQRRRVQIAIAGFMASWDNYGRIGSQRFRLWNKCQERCHPSVRLTRVER